MEDTAKSILDDCLPAIDNILSVTNKPLSQRPLSATLMFIKNNLVSVEAEGFDKYEGEEITKFIDTPWFIGFQNYVTEWYKTRYGKAFEASNSNLSGLIFIHNYPYELSFPYSLAIDEGDEATFSLKFLNELNDDEEWKSYIVANPELNLFDETEIEEIRIETANVLKWTRHSFYCLNTIDSESAEAKTMASSISQHLKSVVQNITSSANLEFNQAIWDLHLVLEKSLKALLIQNKGSFPKTHDLIKLFKLSDFSHREDILKLLVSFPEHRKVINMRYDNADFRTIFEVRRLYQTGLKILYEISKLFKIQFSIHNGIFYIKRPKYAGAKLA
ncbi:MAG: HEPN domain-containing protein [Phenylobacterium sp.]|jgi:HEPN domain-containing protein